MTRQHDLDIIRAACVAANPEIMEPDMLSGFRGGKIARTIRLADVLLAIGELFSVRGRLNAATEELLKLYNLREDSLDAQSDATLSFLGGLLG